MPKAPVEFTVQGHRFRRQPLPAMPLVREYDKLRIRLDNDSGVLNALAFSFDGSDFAEMRSLDPAGIARIVRLLSMLVDGNNPHANDDASPEGDEDGEAELKPKDTLPRKLDELCLYYARVGKVEYATMMPGTDDLDWHALASEGAFDKHPFELAPLVVAAHVIGGLFGPFVDLLPGLSEKVKAAMSSLSSNSSAEPDEATAPTSPT